MSDVIERLEKHADYDFFVEPDLIFDAITEIKRLRAEAASQPALLAAAKRFFSDNQCCHSCDGPHEDCPCLFCTTAQAIALAEAEKP